eukprot:TRINITY_DN2168_c0_g1_i1.p1 TRINITY_DN2168_c0_g1~~TRINITY_DN2168_c0_g1_i1.p1  ORF type:complete len:1073 (-),score=270.64 TRINITY_DN2168_c0_g1_i1:36-3254(-)
MMIVQKQLILFVIFACLFTANSQCPARLSSDAFEPPVPFVYNPLPSPIARGSSELITPNLMPSYDEFFDGWPRIDCPHLSSTINWEDESTWSTTLGHVPTSDDSVVTLPENSKVLISSCSLIGHDENTPFGTIVVPESSTLVFDDTPMELHVHEIDVRGTLVMGTEDCRLFSKINIVFHGNAASSSVDNSDRSKPSKGIISYDGTVDMHGKLFHPTWTRLAGTVDVGSEFIYLQEKVNWEVGQEILLVTSVWFDCPEEYEEDWCKPCYSWQTCDVATHQNEVHTIKSIDETGTVIQIDGTAQYEHYADSNYQTEVSLLSRNIAVKGTDEGDFGAHILVSGTSGSARISGVSCTNCGQKNILGRYPFHFHILEDGDNAKESYFQDCSVINSHFRGYVIHSTHHVLLSRNTAYNVWGMCYYLEDGVEENNRLEYNFVAHVHPIKAPANGGGGQGGESFYQEDGLIVPADTSAAGFYISNPYNWFIGNAASGGWSGFAFPNIPYPINTHKGSDLGSLNPQQRPNIDYYGFDGNTAHSSGFYWQGHGSCLYVGAELIHDDSHGGDLFYNSGRNERQTQLEDGTPAWQTFTNTKTWLCNRGINHWGDRAFIDNYESHDNLRSAVMFGESGFKHGIVNARTGNENGLSQQEYRGFRQGFEFYDTWVKTMLSDIVFRNFDNPETDAVISYMTHSDEFLPQGINAVQMIKYENCNNTVLINIPNCGSICGDDQETMSARMASVFDYDGSLSLANTPQLIGSHLSWWNTGNCIFEESMHVWRCPLTDTLKPVYVKYHVNGIYDGCDSSSPLAEPGTENVCSGQNAAYTVGYVSQFGNTRSIKLSPWSGVAGPSNIGWYWRTPWGAPSQFSIRGYQIPREHFIITAIRYPEEATFDVKITSQWWSDLSYDSIPESTFDEVMRDNESINDPEEFDCTNIDWWEFCNNTGGVTNYGIAWHFDGEHLYIRVVNPACYNANQHEDSCENAYFEYEDMKLYDIFSGFGVLVTVDCPGCAIAHAYRGVTYYDIPDENVGFSLTEGVEDGNMDDVDSIDDFTGTDSSDENSDGNSIIIVTFMTLVTLLL